MVTSKNATAPAAPATRRCTLHLLHDVAADSLREALNPKYEDAPGFEVAEVAVGDVLGLLCTGVVGGNKPPDWVAAVDALTGTRPAVENKTAAGALLVPVGGALFALTFGMGHLLLDPSRTTPGFGLGFALRVLSADAIKQVTHSVMDARGRTDRNSAAQVQHLHSFGIEAYGEVVSRLSGAVDVSALGLAVGKGGKKTVQVAGTDALKIDLGAGAADLLSDLEEIHRVFTEQSPAPGFEMVARVRPLKPTDGRREQIEAVLEELLGQDEPNRVAATLPTECLDEGSKATTYRMKIGPRRELITDLSLGEVLARTRRVSRGGRLRALKDGYVQMCADEHGEEVLSRQLPAHKWLAAEVALGTSRFFLHEGRWFEMGDEYLDGIRQQVRDLLAEQPGVSLIDWTSDLKDEEAYNHEAAEHGFVCLDRKKLHTTQHPHGIEACDLLGPDDELIHVKRAKTTAPLNHLFAQGRLSADALRFDGEARRKFITRVEQIAPERALPENFVPRKVVYAISLKSGKPVTADSLFTFAQVSLMQAAVALRNVGIEVAVANIRTR
ncbi:DUF6119 family protein [Saccharopolyspora cebuensis]|uniref:DUF6119 family protein n=1 Tax=Saccharopolyspora cebuensis TaxID=418759 RepID=UPI0031EC25C7